VNVLHVVETDEPHGSAADQFGNYLRMIGRYPVPLAEEVIEFSKKIEAGLLAQDLLAHSDSPPADKRDLQQISREGRVAFTKMVNHNLRLVVSIARPVRTSSIPILDLVQAGNAGLILAVQRLDWAKGY
jgi:RNA polymerase primary sigma factor